MNEQLLGLLQETGLISLIADWHILSDIIPETINMGDISALITFFFLK